MPVSGNVTAATVESYAAQLDGNTLLTIFGKADGSGNIYDGGVVVGSSTAYGLFTVASSSNVYFNIASSTGNVGVGTRAASSTLHVVGTFQTNGTSTMSGATTIDDLTIGAATFDTDAGQVTWMDMPVTNGSASGTKESYTINIDGNAMLTVYAEADGAGSIQNKRIGIGVTSPTLGPLEMASGAYVTTGGVWTNSSDKNKKENFKDLDAADILASINKLKITQWNYKAESSSTMHIGPMAQDFHALFNLGGSETSISTIDPAGVSLIGIQALSKRIEDLEKGMGITGGNLQGNVNADGQLSSDTNITVKDATFTGNITVKGFAQFNSDAVGQAKILRGDISVHVGFDHEYIRRPIITLTPEQTLADFRYAVMNVTATGFDIQISANQLEDVLFDWHSFPAAENSKIYVSDKTMENVTFNITNLVGSSESTTPAPVAPTTDAATPTATPTPEPTAPDTSDAPAVTDTTQTTNTSDVPVPEAASTPAPENTASAADTLTP